MARIEIPEPQFSVPVVDIPAASTAGVSTIGQASQAFDQAASAFENRQDQNGRVEAAQQSSAIRTKYGDLALRAMKEGRIKNENDVLSFSNDFSREAGDVVANASPYARPYLNLALVDAQRDLHEKMLSHMLDQQEADRFTGAKDYYGNVAAQIWQNPDSFDKLHAETGAFNQGFQGSIEHQNELGTLQGALGEHALIRRGIDHPIDVLKEIDDGTAAARYHIDGARLPYVRRQVEENRNQQLKLLHENYKNDATQDVMNGVPPRAPPALPDNSTESQLTGAANQSVFDELSFKGHQQRANIVGAQYKLQNGMPFDPKNEADMQGLDGVFKAQLPEMTQAVQAGTRQYQIDHPEATPADMARVHNNLTNSYYIEHFGNAGVLPATMASQMRAQLRGGTPDEQVSAADLLTRLSEMNPKIADDYKDELRDAIQLRSFFNEGYSPVDAVRLQQELRAKRASMTPEALNQLEGRYAQEVQPPPSVGGVKKPNANEQFLNDKFGAGGSSWWPGNWFQTPPSVTAPVQANFDSIVKDEWMRNNFNLKNAQEAAFSRLRSVIGVTQVNGQPETMRSAPEDAYGLPSLSADQNARAIHDQAQVDALRNTGQRDITNVQIVPLPDTGHGDVVDPQGKPLYGLQIVTPGQSPQYVSYPDDYADPRKAGKPIPWQPDLREIQDRLNAMNEQERKQYLNRKVVPHTVMIRGQPVPVGEENLPPLAAGQVSRGNIETVPGQPISGQPLVYREINSPDSFNDPMWLRAIRPWDYYRAQEPSHVGNWFVVPTADASNKGLNNAESIGQFHRTGQHYGIFRTKEEADAYVQKLMSQANTKPSGVAPPAPPPQAMPEPGMIVPGNIDLNNRPTVTMPDGSQATVRSESFNIDGREVLLPTISEDGRVMSEREAVAQFRKTGKHLGIFDTAAAATAFAQKLHEAQAKLLKDRAEEAAPASPGAAITAPGPESRPTPSGVDDTPGAAQRSTTRRGRPQNE